MCMWSPWRWEGCEHCVPVNLCKWGFLLMAGLWLCTNGCRCVDGGRTSLVTVLISGGGPRGQLHDAAPTGGHGASADNSSSLSRSGREGWRKRKRILMLKIWTWCAKAFVIAGACILIRRNVSAWQGNWLQKFWEFESWKWGPKSSTSSYRNPDCLQLSEHQKRHWQHDIVIFQSKLTPGAPASFLTATHRATAWIESTAHGFDWTATGIIRHFSSNSGDIICHFSFHSNRANECCPTHTESRTSLQLLIFRLKSFAMVLFPWFFSVLSSSSFLSFLKWLALREESPHECIRES